MSRDWRPLRRADRGPEALDEDRLQVRHEERERREERDLREARRAANFYRSIAFTRRQKSHTVTPVPADPRFYIPNTVLAKSVIRTHTVYLRLATTDSCSQNSTAKLLNLLCLYLLLSLSRFE